MSLQNSAGDRGDKSRTFSPWSHTVSLLDAQRIHVIDSTTMGLVANCLDWANHRPRKAAAKTHMRLNLENLLPGFVIVDTAAEHDRPTPPRGHVFEQCCSDICGTRKILFD